MTDPVKITGQVIAAFGRHMLVRLEDGAERRARPFGRALTVVCGDRVRCRKSDIVVKLLRTQYDFFDALRTKLKWGQR